MFKSHSILFVCLLLFWCCDFLMLLEVSWQLLKYLDTSWCFTILHVACWLLLKSFFCLLEKRFPQHKSNNKPTSKVLWLWEPQAYQKISNGKKHCQLITSLIKGCLKARVIPDSWFLIQSRWNSLIWVLFDKVGVRIYEITESNSLKLEKTTCNYGFCVVDYGLGTYSDCRKSLGEKILEEEKMYNT